MAVIFVGDGGYGMGADRELAGVVYTVACRGWGAVGGGVMGVALAI